ncbi:phage antirepressor KilAC domain-containing protein [Streptosporangium canum]|uniref:phage antirepressor KilAC domain-containing protein n=1 Tax=Streptosporangium canum TaxID=324952 RepID=UPI00378EF94A
MNNSSFYGDGPAGQGSDYTEMELFGDTAMSPFDAIRREDEDGEHWFARETQALMGYAKWQDFLNSVERAKVACANNGMDVASNFMEVHKVSGGRGPAGLDYRLTRFASYLIAMNGDPRKDAVAKAQAYFAAKTREAEMAIPQPRPSMDLDSIDELERLNFAFGKAIAAAKQERAGRLVAEAKVAELEPAAAQAEIYAAADGLTTKRAFARDVQQWASPRGIKVTQQQVFDFLAHIGLITRAPGSEHDQATAQAIKDDKARNATKKVEMPDGTILKVKYGKLTSKGEAYAWKRIYTAIGEHGTLDLVAIRTPVTIG